MTFKLNGNETRSRSRMLVLLAASFLLMCAMPQAGADTLDAPAVKSLVSGHTWKLKMTSAILSYWTWKSDGSVCPRHAGMDSQCMDDGTWKLDGKRVCYELTYLGRTQGWKSSCLHIVDHGQGRYEALDESGMTFFEFSVAE